MATTSTTGITSNLLIYHLYRVLVSDSPVLVKLTALSIQYNLIEYYLIYYRSLTHSPCYCRFQLRSHPVEQADDMELEQEAAWIFNQAFNTRPVSYQVMGRSLRCIRELDEILCCRLVQGIMYGHYTATIRLVAD